jgi:hypothetical protein
VDPNPRGSVLILAGWIRIQAGKIDPLKMRKGKKFLVLKCWVSFLKAGGFSCSLDLPLGGLGINILHFDQKFDLFFDL